MKKIHDLGYNWDTSKYKTSSKSRSADEVKPFQEQKLFLSN